MKRIFTQSGARLVVILIAGLVGGANSGHAQTNWFMTNNIAGAGQPWSIAGNWTNNLGTAGLVPAGLNNGGSNDYTIVMQAGTTPNPKTNDFGDASVNGYRLNQLGFIVGTSIAGTNLSQKHYPEEKAHRSHCIIRQHRYRFSDLHPL